MLINNSYTPYSNQTQNKRKQQPSRNFRGNNPLVAFSTFIENNGFLGEFLTVDTVGMATPRTIQGYNRNSKELGRPNYKAGTEELIRELLSGPAFFFVPLGVLSTAALIKGPSAKVETSTMDAFKPIMQKTATGFQDTSAIKKDFVKNLVSTAFDGYKNNSEQKQTIENVLNQVADGSISSKKAKKAAGDALTILNKSNGKYLDNTDMLKLGTKEISINNLVSDVPNYLKDFTKKAAKTTENKENFITKFHSKAKNVRNASNILAVTALGLFLLFIPKLYQQDKKFPGTEGLAGADTQASESKKMKGVKA